MPDSLSDLPLSDAKAFDAFGCRDLVIKIAKLFGARPAPPANIAVYGPWGSGKSSLLCLLRTELKGSLGKNAPLWIEIDAWAYQNEDTLIYAILAQLYEEAKEPVPDALLRIALGTTLSLADFVLKFATDKNLSVKDVAEHMTRAEGSQLLESKHIALRNEFAKVAAKLRKVSDRHVLIAIDNLDRCKPDAAISVLETLFLVGNTSDCTFLITVDQLVLISFLNRQYQGTQFSGARYLEKIFPIAFRIPDPWVCWYYSDAVQSIPEPGKPTDEKLPPDQVYIFLDRLLQGTKWDDRTKPDDGNEDTAFATVWHYLSQPRILRNPRRIKRIVRIIRDYKPKGRKDAERILFLVIVADLWPDAFEFFISTDAATWKVWLLHLASASEPAPTYGVLMNDQALRDFVNQMWSAYDPDLKSITPFKDKCPILDHDKMLDCLKQLRVLGL